MTQTNYFVNARRIDKNFLMDFIKEHPDQDVNKLLALYSLKTGLKMTTLKVYLRELKEAGVLD